MQVLKNIKYCWVDVDYNSDEEYINMEPGSKNGIDNGLSFLLDVESYEYAYFHQAAKGFSIALSDSRDRPVVSQQGKKYKLELMSGGIFRCFSLTRFVILFLDIQAFYFLWSLLILKNYEAYNRSARVQVWTISKYF